MLHPPPTPSPGASSSVSHRLNRSASVGLVSARAEGPYGVYSLDVDARPSVPREHLAEEALPRLAGDADLGAFDRKVFAIFSDGDGRITAFPSQRKQYLVLVRHTLQLAGTRSRIVSSAGQLIRTGMLVTPRPRDT